MLYIFSEKNYVKKCTSQATEMDGQGMRELGIRCGVIEWLKRSMLGWFGHLERMQGRSSQRECIRVQLREEVREGSPQLAG